MARVRIWLSYQIDQLRSTEIGCIALMFACFSLAIALYFYEDSQITLRKSVLVTAHITGFGVGGGKYHPGLIFVSAQDAKGLVGGTSVRPNRIEGCKVGDAISAERYGIALTLDPAPCLTTRASK
jgi:hypothetical protein